MAPDGFPEWVPNWQGMASLVQTLDDSDWDDRRLVKRSVQGDRGAFEALYRRYGAGVYGIAVRLVLDRTEAEDLTQEAFVQIWRQLKSFRFDSSLSTWIYRVTTNVVLGALRRRKQVIWVDGDSDGVESELAGDDHSLSHEVESQLRQLPARARMVLVLHDLVGMTHEEIGREMAIAPGTSKTQLFRARRLYREGATSDE